MRVTHGAHRLVLAALGFFSGAAAVAQSNHILLVTDSAGSQAVETITERIDETLRRELDDFELYTESLDVNRFPQAAHQEVFARFLGEKYTAHAPDIVIASGPATLTFFADRGATLFPGVPLIYVGVRATTVPSDGRLPNATGIVSRFDVVETVDLALRLQPDARRLFVITGTAPLDVGWYAFARERLELYQERLEVIHFAGLPKATLLEQLARVPRDSIVLLLTMRRDGAGGYFVTPNRLVEELAEVSAAPLYGVYDTQLGRGVVGGYVESFEAMGDVAAGLALRVLRGENAATIPPVAATNVYAVDDRQLKRWNLDESRLPPQTRVSFREPMLWTQYRAEILGTAAVVALQTLLIVVLLLYIRKRRVERTLHETEDRYRNVVETQTDLICRYLPDTTLTFVNEAYCRYFGRPRNELIGQRFVDLVPETERQAVLDQVRSLGDGTKSVSSIHRALRPDGSVRWQQWIDRPILDGDNVVEIQGIGHDITDLKEAETEARQRREQVTHLTRVAILGELSGALAHELNQPMTAILSNAQAAERLLKREPPDLGELREILKDIVADDMRAGEVIRRLRTLLKPGTTTFQPLDVCALVREVLALVRTQLLERHVTVTERLANTLPPVHGDRVQLQQVLLNLLVNASDAVGGNEPNDRALVAETAHEDGFVRVSVRDNGTGLSPQVAGRLFEPFVTTKNDGLGLGLSICRSIINLHGGRLSARNNGDRGATVEFTLPVVRS